MIKKIVVSFILMMCFIMAAAWEYNIRDIIVSSGVVSGSGIGVDSDVENNSPDDEENDKKVYLTFDDGPSRNTEQVLDILEKNKVRATFFLIGNQINDDTLKTLGRMIKDGNQIGIHTYSHEAAEIYASADDYYSDVMKARDTISECLGITPSVYRFPWGSSNCYIAGYRKDIITRLRAAGLEYCDWNVSGEDSVGHPYASKIIENVRSNYDVYDNPVLLLHDSSTSVETVKALDTIIKMYKKAGYGFGVLSEREGLYQWKGI